MNSTKLDTANHSRDSAGMTYVYPVVSRRAGGVSVGINLNPNNACNWRCIYCQVPDLIRGTAPEIDLTQLESELRRLLDQIINGDFMQQRVGESARHLEDIAFSGNGEPTSSSAFPQAVAVVEQVLGEFGLIGKIKVRLITNGSLIDRPYVSAGLELLANCNGEVWFKLDAATTEGIARINDVHLKPEHILERLLQSASLCPTWVQSCLFTLDGEPPAEAEIAAYVELLSKAAGKLAGVHLYGLARPSMQAEAPRLGRLSESWMQALAARLGALGLQVKVSP